MFITTHEGYLEAVEKITSFLEPDPKTMERASSTQSISQALSVPVTFHHARLPRINHPKFDGSPSDWLSFKDLFASLVLSNPSLTAVEKLQYLKTSLVGSAAHLIKNTALIADNFQKAWESLISFFENKRLLVNAALHSLINLKRMTKESATELENLYTQIMQIYRTLETLQRPVSTWDDVLVFIAVQRLDSDSVKAWEHHLGSEKEPPTWSQLSEFLITRLLSLQAFEKSRTGTSASQGRKGTAKAHYQGKYTSTREKSSSLSCPLCTSDHYVASCPKYTGKTVQQRLEIVAKQKLCYNCLGFHKASACRITKRCQKCGKKHHTTIHDTKRTSSMPTVESKKQEDSRASTTTTAQVLHSSVTLEPSKVLLATALVTVVSPHGVIAKVRALLDQGSEISLISERLVQRLNLPRIHSGLTLVGVGAQQSNRTKGIASFTLTPHYESSYNLPLSAHILPKLTSSLPSTELHQRSWKHLKNLNLADPNFMSPRSIDLILGVDVYSQIIEGEVIRESADMPVAQLTKLGWIISGRTGFTGSSDRAQGFHVSIDQEIYNLLHRFWELDSVPSSNPSQLSSEEQDCETHFEMTHRRDSSGRYIVRLPFKQPTSEFIDRNAAARLVTFFETHATALNSLEYHSRLNNC